MLTGFMCSPYTPHPVRWSVLFDKSISNTGRIIYSVCFLVEKSIFMEILIPAITIDT